VSFSGTAPTVIPAVAGILVVDQIAFQGIQPYELDSGSRRNDRNIEHRQFFIVSRLRHKTEKPREPATTAASGLAHLVSYKVWHDAQILRATQA
jgi:hypothetical protein